MTPRTRIELALDRIQSADALEMVAIIVERVAHGEKEYGELDVVRSTRNWHGEALEELADCTVYMAIELLKRSR